MRMAPTSTNRLGAAMLLLVVTIVGCLLLTQCDAQTTRQDRINNLCDSLSHKLPVTDTSTPYRWLYQNQYEYSFKVAEINSVKARVAESIARFCKNNDAGN